MEVEGDDESLEVEGDDDVGLDSGEVDDAEKLWELCILSCPLSFFLKA